MSYELQIRTRDILGSGRRESHKIIWCRSAVDVLIEPRLVVNHYAKKKIP